MIDGLDRVEFTDVEVVNADALIVMCRVGTKVVGVPPRRMRTGTTILAETGAKGSLVISREMAMNLGLL